MVLVESLYAGPMLKEVIVIAQHFLQDYYSTQPDFLNCVASYSITYTIVPLATTIYTIPTDFYSHSIQRIENSYEFLTKSFLVAFA